MNWYLFFGAITWCVTILAIFFVINFMFIFRAWDEIGNGRALSTFDVSLFILSLILLLFGISTIVGMGWL